MPPFCWIFGHPELYTKIGAIYRSSSFFRPHLVSALPISEHFIPETWRSHVHTLCICINFVFNVMTTSIFIRNMQNLTMTVFYLSHAILFAQFGQHCMHCIRLTVDHNIDCKYLSLFKNLTGQSVWQKSRKTSHCTRFSWLPCIFITNDTRRICYSCSGPITSRNVSRLLANMDFWKGFLRSSGSFIKIS